MFHMHLPSPSSMQLVTRVNQISYQSDSYMYIFTSTDQWEKGGLKTPNKIVFFSFKFCCNLRTSGTQAEFLQKLNGRGLVLQNRKHYITLPSFLLGLFLSLVTFDSLSQASFSLFLLHLKKDKTTIFSFQWSEFQAESLCGLSRFCQDERQNTRPWSQLQGSLLFWEETNNLGAEWSGDKRTSEKKNSFTSSTVDLPRDWESSESCVIIQKMRIQCKHKYTKVILRLLWGEASLLKMGTTVR